MTHRQIFKEIYGDNKRYLFACLTAFLFFSVLAFGGGGVAQAEALDAQGTATALGGSFGKTMAPVIGTGYFAGIDTSWVMVILSAVSLSVSAGKGLGLAGFDKLSGFSFGIFENTYVSTFLLVWYGLPLLLKAFSKTYAAGLALENLLKKWNGVVMAVITSSQVVANVSPKATVNAASVGAVASSVKGALPQWAMVIGCFFVLVITMALYFLMRYLFALIDIVAVPVCTFVPFVSFLLGVGKLILVVVTFLTAMFMPAIFFVFFLFTVAAALLLFRKAYLASRYFNNVFAKPLFRKLFGGYKTDYPLVAKRIPAKIRKQLDGVNVELAIPVYLQKKLRGTKDMPMFDRWWLISSGGRTLLMKPMFGKKDCWRIPLVNVPERKVFINQFFFYYEVFNLIGPETNLTNAFKRVSKQYHVVFSKEYFHRYQDIKRITGFTDFAEYRSSLMQKKPQAQQAGGWGQQVRY